MTSSRLLICLQRRRPRGEPPPVTLPHTAGPVPSGELGCWRQEDSRYLSCRLLLDIKLPSRPCAGYFYPDHGADCELILGLGQIFWPGAFKSQDGI